MQICDDVFWQNYKKFRDEEQKIMQAELAKVQQAMQMQQGGNLPMPWDGASPPAARVSFIPYTKRASFAAKGSPCLNSLQDFDLHTLEQCPHALPDNVTS